MGAQTHTQEQLFLQRDLGGGWEKGSAVFSERELSQEENKSSITVKFITGPSIIQGRETS